MDFCHKMSCVKTVNDKVITQSVTCYLSDVKQVAKLSQRDRDAGWVSFDQKWKTIFCRQYRSIFNHCDIIGLQSYQIR